MRVLACVCVAAAVALAVPEVAHGKIGFLRGTIVSVSYSEYKGAVFGSITVARGSLTAKNRQTITALITKRTLVSGAGPRGRDVGPKDLRPGMAVEITVSGSRVGDDLWRADSIRVLDRADAIRP